MASDNKNNKAHTNQNIQQVHGTSGYVVKEGYGADFLRFINANQLNSKEAMEKARRFAKRNKVDPR